jgi:hypothetical protein
MPVLTSYTLTHQWVRELRRWQRQVLVAVDVRLPDDEQVTVGRYGQPPRRVTSAEAVAAVRELADPRGWEIFVPRAIASGEVRRIRSVRQGIGWRYQPDAHGRAPCACPVCLPAGSYRASRIRARYSGDQPQPTIPELMARLRAATGTQELVDAVWMIGARRRGSPEDLAYLVDHPKLEVRRALAEALTGYRGRVARDLLARLAVRDGPYVEPEE